MALRSGNKAFRQFAYSDRVEWNKKLDWSRMGGVLAQTCLKARVC